MSVPISELALLPVSHKVLMQPTLDMIREPCVLLLIVLKYYLEEGAG